MDNEFIKFEISKDLVVYNNVDKTVFEKYSRVLCKINAGVFVLCTKGTIRMKINLGEFTIQTNDFITFLPNTFFYVEEFSEDVEICIVAFSSRFLESTNYIKTISSIILNISRYPVVHLSDKVVEEYMVFYQLLVKTQGEQGSVLFDDCLCHIQNILYKGVINMYEKYSTWKEPIMNREKEIVHEFINLAWTHYVENRKVSFYAAALRISLPHFCSVIKKATGKTARDIIATIVIADAKVQLKSTTSPIKEIAINLGYHNIAFFDKYFRRYVGMSPLEYRNNKKQKN